jgi:hypothetical protein
MVQEMYPFLKASNDNLVIGSNMKEINIKVKNISQKQWSLLLVELNLVSENWKKYGPVINIKAKNFGKTIKWGKKKHGTIEED